MNSPITKDLHEYSLTSEEFPELGEVGIVLVGIAKIAKSCTRQPRRDDPMHGHLHLTVNGSGSARIDCTTHQLTAGHAYVVPPKTRTWQWDTNSTPKEPWEVFFVRFSGKSPLGKLLQPGGPFARGGYDPSDMLWVFERMRHEFHRPRRTTIRRHLAAMLAEHTREILVSPARRIDQLASLWRLVEAKPGEAWDLDALSRAAGICREKLRQICLTVHGRSPVHQVAWLRMRHAASLLRSGYHRVDEVSLIAGYTNPNSFSTAFRRIFQTSPKQYQLRSLTETDPRFHSTLPP